MLRHCISGPSELRGIWLLGLLYANSPLGLLSQSEIFSLLALSADQMMGSHLTSPHSGLGVLLKELFANSDPLGSAEHSAGAVSVPAPVGECSHS